MVSDLLTLFQRTDIIMVTLLNFLFYFFVCTGMYFLRFIQACMQYIVWLAIFHVAKGGAHALYKLGTMG